MEAEEPSGVSTAPSLSWWTLGTFWVGTIWVANKQFGLVVAALRT